MMSNNFKEKYEELELKYNNFVTQTKQVALDYESLRKDYASSRDENTELVNRLKEVESKLAELEEAIEPAINEYNELNTKLEIEQLCRTEAEIYASKIVKDNKMLKRKSAMIQQHLKSNLSLPPLEAIKVNDVDDEDTSSKEIIKLRKQYENCQIELDKIKAQLVETQKRLNEYEQAIEPAIAEFEELSNKLAIEQMCKDEAAIYASKTVQENKKLKRQSQMLVQHLKPDFNIKDIDIILESDNTKDVNENIDKLKKEITELNAKLSESNKRETQLNEKVKKLNSDNTQLKGKIIQFEKNENLFEKAKSELTLLKDRLQKENKIKEQIEQLAEKNATDESKSLVESLKTDLKSSADEVARLQSRVHDLENWKIESELEISDLKSKLESALAPPPPPPPPPPPTVKTIFEKKSLVKSLRQKTDSPLIEQNDKFKDELAKMMEDINSGKTLKKIRIEKNVNPSEKKENEMPPSLQFLHNMMKSKQDDKSFKKNRNSKNLQNIFKKQPVVLEKTFNSSPASPKPEPAGKEPARMSDINANRSSKLDSADNYEAIRRKPSTTLTLSVAERKAILLQQSVSHESSRIPPPPLPRSRKLYSESQS